MSSKFCYFVIFLFLLVCPFYQLSFIYETCSDSLNKKCFKMKIQRNFNKIYQHVFWFSAKLLRIWVSSQILILYISYSESSFSSSFTWDKKDKISFQQVSYLSNFFFSSSFTKLLFFFIQFTNFQLGFNLPYHQLLGCFFWLLKHSTDLLY